MGKYAKWIGSGLGWAFGGPIGAVFGFAVGAYFDMASQVEGGKITTQSGDFEASLLVLAAAVMKADGKIMRSELDYVKGYFEQQFGSANTAQRMMFLKQAMEKDIPVADVCMQIRGNMDSHSRLLLLQFLFGLALADGVMDATEISVIEQIARWMGIMQRDFLSIKAMYVKDTKSSYQILEIDQQATDIEIKKAYRRLALKYHPDKVSHLGEEYQHAAKEKFQKLNEAYENIKKERGIV